jgi:signal transduction histidine kinase
LRVQDKTVGTLTCFTSSASRLSDTDLSLLETVADQVAVAVENARLYARSRDLAALEERARLARELHDSVTQALFSMTLHARAAEMALVRDGMPTDGAVAQSLKQLLELTRGALAEMRALIFELRPGALGEEGLAAALRKHAAAVSAREGLAVDVEAPPERLGLDASVEEHLYRLSQEALHNVVKHARASHVLIRLAPDGDGHLLLEITDDGAGFEPDLVPPGHLGMSTMADRVRQVGGTLAVVSAPGEGTSVRAKVAIKRASREETRQVVGKGA